MSNYLTTIEEEFSRARGKQSLLAPIDWHLAASWEKKGIPLSIVLRAMGDVVMKFNSSKRHDTINSLRYYEKEVEKKFAEWLSSQVGKSIATSTIEENNMNQFQTFDVSEDTNTLEFLAEKLNRKNLPEPLDSAVAKARGEVLGLIDEARSKQLSSDAIETQLEKISSELDLSVAVSLPESVRVQMLDTIKREYERITITAESRQKLLIKMAYAHFGLPKLTLFEL